MRPDQVKLNRASGAHTGLSLPERRQEELLLGQSEEGKVGGEACLAGLFQGHSAGNGL